MTQHIIRLDADRVLDLILQAKRLQDLYSALYWDLQQVLYRQKWNVLKCLARHNFLQSNILSHLACYMASDGYVYGLYMLWCVGVEIDFNNERCLYNVSSNVWKLLANLTAMSKYPGLRGLAAAVYRQNYRHIPDNEAVPEDVVRCLMCFQHYESPVTCNRLEFKWRLAKVKN